MKPQTNNIMNNWKEEYLLTLRIIDRLLTLPGGEQIYAKRLEQLFNSLYLLTKPTLTIGSTLETKE